MKRRAWTLATVAALLLLGFSAPVWLSSAARPETTVPAAPDDVVVQAAPPPQNRALLGLLQRGAAPSRLYPAIEALGDRLERRGRERAVVTGFLQLGDGAPQTPINLVLQLPRQLRLT